MKIPFSLINSQNPTLLRNYLLTFGYLIISDFFTNDEVSLQNSIWDKKFHELTKSNVDNTETYLSVPNYLERSGSPLFTLDNGNRFLEVVDLLVGSNSIYLGSSGSEMTVPTPWHRDIFIKTPIFKFGTYLNAFESESTEGQLCIVPGSQHAGDLYADSLSSAVHWPEHFGVSKNPPQYPLLQASDGSSTLDNYPKINAKIEPFNYLQLKVGSRDLLVFDQRLVHGSTYYTSSKSRRMLVSVFCVNPKQVAPESKLCWSGYKVSDALLELNHSVLNQLNASDLNNLYQDLANRPELFQVLESKIGLFKNLERTSKMRVKMRDSLDDENEFNRRNMSDRYSPMIF
jgi:hypothetical protein